MAVCFPAVTILLQLQHWVTQHVSLDQHAEETASSQSGEPLSYALRE